MAINLEGYTRVVEEDFDNDLPAIWSTGPRRGLYANTSPSALFLDGAEVNANGARIGLDPLTVEDGKLAIGSGIIPNDKLANVKQLLRDVGQDSVANNVKYYTGMVATDKSWAQTYGYYEVVAKIPVGEGHWPAFWMVSEGEQWPPEIDIVEAYGKQLASRTRIDGIFRTALHFDEYDESGANVHQTRILNPYDLDVNGDPTPAARRTAGGKTYGHFTNGTDSAKAGIDIYEEFATYAMEWTPTYISFLFGRDRDSLVETYRVPTPDDVHVPLYFQANDQINSNWGWNVIPGYESQVFAPDNRLEIDRISIYARDPAGTVVGSGPTSVLVGRQDGTQITGTAGDDRIVTGRDLDLVELRSGRDIVFVENGNANTIISDFGADDAVVISGWYLDGVAGAIDALVQVGSDVWLPKGAYPGDPQSIIFRDTTIAQVAAGNIVVRHSTTPDVWSSAEIDGKRLTNQAGTNYVVAAAEGSKLSDSGSNNGGTVTIRGSDQGDLYYIFRPGTVIRENVGGGVDTVYAYRSVTLAANVEGLVGDSAIDGMALTGNGLGNRIVSGAAAQILSGLGGDDLLDLRAGTRNDVRYGSGGGHDTVVGFGTGDRLVLADIAFPGWAAVQARLEQVGDDVVLDLGTGQSVTFRDLRLQNLGPSAITWVDGPLALSGTGFDPYWRPNGIVSERWLHDHAPFLAPYARFYGSESGGILRGGNADDALFAGGGATQLQGRSGRDLLFGGRGDDRLEGNAGDDRLEGGGGLDRLTGGAGADTFVFVPGSAPADLVTDFSSTQRDRLDVSAFGNGLADSGIRLVARAGWIDLVDDGAVFASVRNASLAAVSDGLLWDGQYG